MPLIILSIGKDEPLLHSRNAILRSAGYVVTAETSFRRALSTFQVGDYDAILLCHSLDAIDAEKFASEVHKRSPSTPVVQVGALSSHGRLPGIQEVESDPHKLLDSLREVIEAAVSRTHRIPKSQANDSEGRDV